MNSFGKEMASELHRGYKEQEAVNSVKRKKFFTKVKEKFNSVASMKTVDKITGLLWTVVMAPVVALIAILAVIVEHNKAEDQDVWE